MDGIYLCVGCGQETLHFVVVFLCPIELTMGLNYVLTTNHSQASTYLTVTKWLLLRPDWAESNTHIATFIFLIELSLRL
jgi:hypothetical protein